MALNKWMATCFCCYLMCFCLDIFCVSHWNEDMRSKRDLAKSINKTRLPTWTFGIIPKKKHHFRIFVHEGLEIVSFISLDMYIYMYLYMVLSSPIEQPVASVGVICSKESLLCSFLEVSKKTHLGAEIVAELTAWLWQLCFLTIRS